MNDVVEATSSSDLAARVTALEKASLAQLRLLWRSRWGAPPRLRSARLLRLIIAWRLQAEVEGGLAPEAHRAARSKHAPRRALPPQGTRLTREYRGVRYTAEIGESGVTYAGRSYASLSEVARVITGTRWNGPRFFGLRAGEPL